MSEGLEATVIFLLQLPLSTQFNTASFNQKGNEIHYSLSLFFVSTGYKPLFSFNSHSIFLLPLLTKKSKEKKNIYEFERWFSE